MDVHLSKRCNAILPFSPYARLNFKTYFLDFLLKVSDNMFGP
jgi:hypothetical protein